MLQARMFRVSLLAMLLPSTALAQTEARATSAALLSEAKQLAASGDREGACQQYAASYSLEAQLDALLPLAECFEQDGKLASAYAAYRDAVEIGQRSRDSRWVAADARANQLKPRLSYLTIEVPGPRQLPALSVERDGYRVGSSAWGVPAPVDPGAHVISVKANGYRDWQTTIDVQGEGSAPYVEVPLLEKLGEAELATPLAGAPPAEPAVLPPVAPAPAGPATASPSPSLAQRGQRQGLPPTRVAALVAVSVGVVSVGVGVYFLAKTRSTLSERDGICPSGKDCAPGTNLHLAELTHKAINQQRAEIAFLALGGAAVALGAGLWFWPQRAASGDHAAYVLPMVEPSGGGLLFGGRL
jgi:hypothetical protein